MAIDPVVSIPTASPLASARLSLAPYLAVATRAFRRFSTYRGATFAGVVTNTMFGFVYAYVFEAVHDEVGAIGDYSATDTATYVFAAQGFLLMTGAFGDREISDRIRTGDIAADLYRPIDLQLWWLAHDYGKSAFHALARGIPPFAIGLLVLRLPLPGGALEWIGFAVAVCGAVTLAFTIRFIVNLTGFWLIDARGVIALTAIAQSLLAGHLVPLYFLPGPWETIVRILPFAGITAHPIELLLGGHRGWGAVAVYLHQLVWIAVLLAVGRVVASRARRKLVIQGG